MRCFGRMAVAALCGALLLSASAEASSYVITALGTLGGDHTDASAINEYGQAVGLSRDSSGDYRAFLWTPGGTDGVASNPQMKDLGTLGGDGVKVWDVNNLGQVIGRSQTSAGGWRAFLWTPGGTDGVSSNPQMKDLGHLGGPDFSEALGINDLGQVVGRAGADGGVYHAFLWTPGGTGGVLTNPEMEDLGTLGGWHSRAFGINDAAEVVGGARLAGNDDEHATLWSGASITDLGTIGSWDSVAGDVSETGLVAGNLFDLKDASVPILAFLWTPGGTDGDPSNPQMKTLGTLGGVGSQVYNMNDYGEVVGSSETLLGDRHAFLYTNGAITDLNDMFLPGFGEVLTIAQDINNRGQIVSRQYLLTPIPEPISLIFFGTGVVGVFGFVAKKKMRGRTAP